jgi:hypothetical protein
MTVALLWFYYGVNIFLWVFIKHQITNQVFHFLVEILMILVRQIKPRISPVVTSIGISIQAIILIYEDFLMFIIFVLTLVDLLCRFILIPHVVLKQFLRHYAISRKASDIRLDDVIKLFLIYLIHPGVLDLGVYSATIINVSGIQSCRRVRLTNSQLSVSRL